MEIRKTQGGLALAIAQVVLWGFNKHYRLFSETSLTAKALFEAGDWHGMQRISRERIKYYDLRVLETVERLQREFNTENLSDATWQEVKFQYIILLIDHKQPECAETFFNSVCCKILHRLYYRNDFIFVRPTISTEHLDSDPPAYRAYYPGRDALHASLKRMLLDFELKRDWADLERDVRLVAEAVRERLATGAGNGTGTGINVAPNHQIQVLHSLFFRNKGAYAFGKVINGLTERPFAIPILHDAEGRLVVDTILFDVEDILALFSFARAYFMVHMEVPAAYVQFLHSMLPTRPKTELYTMVGLQKQGKALFYRDFLHHLRHSSDPFVIAPGIAGMVMVVFTLPSFPYVFKVIRDRIPRPKEIDREGVKAKYWMVKLHDRVGRMADTLEYSDVAFPRERFADDLLAELRAAAPSIVQESEGAVIIKHVYIERRMVPLNLYLQRATPEEKRAALDEYGTAIKQLAAANIFPGDMLYKNFGVTRNRRVVFYDYDEIEYMTACNFRVVPPAPNPEAEMAAEPWYPVAKNDVFPAEWRTFLLGDPEVRTTLLELHPDLFEADFWRNQKRRIEEGHVEDVYPYAQAKRFGVAGRV